MIGQIDVVSHHLQTLLGDINLIVSCAFICKVGYFDGQIRETVLLCFKMSILLCLQLNLKWLKQFTNVFFISY